MRVYDLVQLKLVKRLFSGVKWISSMVLHPSGDHLLLGSYDKKLCWFDLDLSSKPYKVLRYQQFLLIACCVNSEVGWGGFQASQEGCALCYLSSSLPPVCIRQ